jgi:hypothetical protein
MQLTLGRAEADRRAHAVHAGIAAAQHDHALAAQVRHATSVSSQPAMVGRVGRCR